MIAMMASVLRMLVISGWIAAGMVLSYLILFLYFRILSYYRTYHYGWRAKPRRRRRPLPFPDRLERRFRLVMYLIAIASTAMAVVLALSGFLPGTH